MHCKPFLHLHQAMQMVPPVPKVLKQLNIATQIWMSAVCLIVCSAAIRWLRRVRLQFFSSMRLRAS